MSTPRYPANSVISESSDVGSTDFESLYPNRTPSGINSTQFVTPQRPRVRKGPTIVKPIVTPIKKRGRTTAFQNTSDSIDRTKERSEILSKLEEVHRAIVRTRPVIVKPIVTPVRNRERTISPFQSTPGPINQTQVHDTSQFANQFDLMKRATSRKGPTIVKPIVTPVRGRSQLSRSLSKPKFVYRPIMNRNPSNDIQQQKNAEINQLKRNLDYQTTTLRVKEAELEQLKGNNRQYVSPGQIENLSMRIDEPYDQSHATNQYYDPKRVPRIVVQDATAIHRDPQYIDLSRLTPQPAAAYRNRVANLKKGIQVLRQKSLNKSNPQSSEQEFERLSNYAIKMHDIIEEKEQTIQGMKANMPASRKVSHVDPREIANLSKRLLEKIIIEKQQFMETKQFGHIRKRIVELREVFNLMLKQLQEFNDNNNSVSETISMLLKLEVSRRMF